MLSCLPSPTASTVYGGTSGLLSTSIASPAARIADSAVSRCPLIATASAPDCHSPLTTRCMSRSRTRPVSENPVLSRAAPPPPCRLPSRRPRRASRPARAPRSPRTAAPPGRPVRRRAPSAPRAAARSRRRAARRRPSPACRPSSVSRSIRSISSSRSLATTGAATRACAAPTVTTSAASTRPAARPSFALQRLRQPAVARGLPTRGSLGVPVVEAVVHDVGEQRHGRVRARIGSRGCSERGAAAACRTSSHVATAASERPHRRAGQAPLGNPCPARARVRRFSDRRCPRPRTTRRAAPGRRRRPAPRPTDA